MNFHSLDTSGLDCIDEFLIYPTGSLLDEDHNDFSSFDIESCRSRALSYDQNRFLSRPPSLSRSLSSPSDATDSPSLSSPVVDTDHDHNANLRLTWPVEGQLRAPLQNQKIAGGHNRSASVSSPVSSPSSLSGDPDHERDCAKCRMTEAEARKCRLERRREQNRASQRKFRARKEAKIREAASQVASLEAYVEFLERQNGDLEATNAELRQQIADMGKDQRSRSRTKSETANKQASSTPRLSTFSDNAPIMTPPSPPIVEPKPPVYDLYLPLFDHELQPRP